jgi:alkyldihydroxyacetonephosphate synthase
MNRRWNGWGNEDFAYPLPENALPFLIGKLGRLVAPSDASYNQVLSSVPASRLPQFTPADTDRAARLMHARGQSFPDWVALRSGHIHAFPDGVATPESSAQICSLLAEAGVHGWQVIPYGGGTSVVGHINPTADGPPVLTISMARLNRLLELDETSRLATFEAGVQGPKLEDQLAQHGYTLGHYPQSFELSTLGGWIATRSSGQQSYCYGRIEELFAGGTIELPGDTLKLPPLPASAAGPDLRQLVLGSEGRLGIISQATVRIRPRPESEKFYGLFFPDWSSGLEAVRSIAQSDLPLSMLRLSNAQETETTLILSGKPKLVSLANRGLRWLGYPESRCMLIYGLTGSHATVRTGHRGVLALSRRHHGLAAGTFIGHTWLKSRFRTPYLRNTLWELGVAIDTLETALPWSRVLQAAQAIQASIATAAEILNERVLVFAHLSHLYPDGASIYITFLFRRSSDPDQTLELWQAMKAAASQEIVRQGGTISHQHGVGIDHAAYLVAEKSQAGIQLLRSFFQSADPAGILNPGKLLPEQTSEANP